MRVRLLAGVTAVTCAAAAWLSAPALAQQSGAQADPNSNNEEGQALVQYVQDVIAGVNVPPDATLTWEPFFVKSEGNQVYVPFTVAIPEDALEDEVNLYYAVVPKGPRMSTFTANPKDGSDTLIEIAGEVTNTASTTVENVSLTVTMLDANGLALSTNQATVASVAAGQTAPFTVEVTEPEGTEQYSVMVDGSAPVFRDLSMRDLPNADSDDMVRVSRAFVAPSGEYELILVMREREPRNAATPRRLALLREDVTLPSFGDGLAISSIFVARNIAVRPEALDPDKQMEEPYTLGNMVIDPITSAGPPSIRQNGELSIIFFVYNAGFDAARKPNVEVQYNFHIKTNEGEQYFNRTNPQQFNAETLPPEFDLTAGHQVVGGQSIPLASFEPGEYRLEMRVNDTLSGQSLTDNIPFIVLGS